MCYARPPVPRPDPQWRLERHLSLPRAVSQFLCNLNVARVVPMAHFLSPQVWAHFLGTAQMRLLVVILARFVAIFHVPKDVKIDVFWGGVEISRCGKYAHPSGDFDY